MSTSTAPADKLPLTLPGSLKCLEGDLLFGYKQSYLETVYSEHRHTSFCFTTKLTCELIMWTRRQTTSSFLRRKDKHQENPGSFMLEQKSAPCSVWWMAARWSEEKRWRLELALHTQRAHREGGGQPQALCCQAKLRGFGDMAAMLPLGSTVEGKKDLCLICHTPLTRFVFIFLSLPHPLLPPAPTPVQSYSAKIWSRWWLTPDNWRGGNWQTEISQPDHLCVCLSRLRWRLNHLLTKL